MSRKSRSSSGSGSDPKEVIDDFGTRYEDGTKTKKKLGAYFLDENTLELEQTPNRRKTSVAHAIAARTTSSNSSTVIAHLENSWSTSSGHNNNNKSRLSAALWPTVSELQGLDECNDTIKISIPGLNPKHCQKNEGSSDGVSKPIFTEELSFVTEQLQVIQETQDLILSELRSDIESLQTENLCLQRNNSRLRLALKTQVDNLNDLVYQLSKELHLTRDFLSAKKEYEENNTPNAIGISNRFTPRDSTTSELSRRKAKSSKSKDTLASSKSAPKDRKSIEKDKNIKDKKDKSPKERKRGFFARFLRPKVAISNNNANSVDE